MDEQTLGTGDSHANAERAEVLAFWFGHADAPFHGRPRKEWFAKDPQFDAEIVRRFGALYARAVAGALDRWRDDAQGCLALVVIFDQFPRNMFRGTPKAFATDDRALALARHAVASGYDRAVPPVFRAFFYLPFEHSESLADQELAVALFTAVEPHEGREEGLRYAVMHRDIIARFGRFPHRNAILGRESTDEELHFLTQPNSGF